MRIAKLLVPAGASCHASSGDTFFPGQGQMVGSRGLHARCGSSAPNCMGMIWPSLIEVEVTVIHPAACETGAIRHAGNSAKKTVRRRDMASPFPVLQRQT